MKSKKKARPVAYTDGFEFYTPKQCRGFDKDLKEDLIPLYKRPQHEDDFKFTINTISENEDGSANCEVEMDDYTKGKLIEIGVIAILKEHIAQEKMKHAKEASV